MKKFIKRFFLFAVIILTIVFLLPTNTFALSKQTSYIDINRNQDLEIGSLSISNLIFKDYSSTSTKAFGLYGSITNSSESTTVYTSTIYYYDKNYNLVAQIINTQTAIPGVSNFNLMSNLSVLGSYNVDDIYYYRLSIDINDNDIYSANESTIPSKSNEYSSYDYVIDKYDINIIVNENNTFDITETITAYFNVAKHGIYRTIPLKNRIIDCACIVLFILLFIFAIIISIN